MGKFSIGSILVGCLLVAISPETPLGMVLAFMGGYTAGLGLAIGAFVALEAWEDRQWRLEIEGFYK